MPMPSDNTPQDLDITDARATGPEQQQRQRQPHEDDNSQYYEQAVEDEGHGPQLLLPAQTIHHHTHPTAAPHSAVLQAHRPEQPHPSPFYPLVLDDQLAFDPHGAIPIDPVLLDARFDTTTAFGDGGGGAAPGFHQGQPEYHWAAAPQRLSSANMDSFMASSAPLPPYNDPAPFVPGMSSFEPHISTPWSTDESLASASTSTSRGPTMSSSMRLPDTPTQASSKTPGSPGRAAAGLNKQPPPAGKDAALASYPGVQLEPRVGGQPGRKRRQTVGPQATAWASADKSRSHRNNSTPGFSTPQVPIAPAPAPTAAATGDDDNNNNIHSRKGSSSGNNNNDSPSMAEGTKETTAAPTTTTTSPKTSDAAGAPPPQPQPGPPTTSSTTGPGPDPRARNRKAANRSRAKSKRAEAELEAAERALGGEHERLARAARALHDEVLGLKTEVLAHARCGDELIERYLANSARLVGSGAGTTTAAAAAMTRTKTTTAAALAGGPSPPLPLPLPQPPAGTVPAGPPGPLSSGAADGLSRVVLSTSYLAPSCTACDGPAAPGAGQTAAETTGGQTP